MEQYRLYGFSSFVADVGGFLGLLLGASLLSLFETCFETCLILVCKAQLLFHQWFGTRTTVRSLSAKC